jgi:hypothetical protein
MGGLLESAGTLIINFNGGGLRKLGLKRSSGAKANRKVLMRKSLRGNDSVVWKEVLTLERKEVTPGVWEEQDFHFGAQGRGTSVIIHSGCWGEELGGGQASVATGLRTVL